MIIAHSAVLPGKLAHTRYTLMHDVRERKNPHVVHTYETDFFFLTYTFMYERCTCNFAETLPKINIVNHFKN